MPTPVSVYTCPHCLDLFEDEDECRMCAEECARDAAMDEVEAWACIRCGEIFRFESTCRGHEKCCAHPEPAGEECCLSCGCRSAEGHRWEPCPQPHFSPIRPACGEYWRKKTV